MDRLKRSFHGVTEYPYGFTRGQHGARRAVHARHADRAIEKLAAQMPRSRDKRLRRQTLRTGLLALHRAMLKRWSDDGRAQCGLEELAA